MPLSILLLFILYIVLVKLLYPNRIKANDTTRAIIADEIRQLGKMSQSEKRVLAVFVITALLWITKDIINGAQSALRLDDTMIAIIGAILLFLVPAGENNKQMDTGKPLMEWPDTSRMAWGVLLLFGGGISLANQLEKAGLIQMLGAWVAGFANGGFILVFAVAVISIFVSEVMSNVAQVIVFAPVIAGISEAMHQNPLQLGLAMTLGASCAGMLPMGTPPNAIVFGSGKLRLRHMTTTGFIMNCISAALITLFCWHILPVAVQAIKY